MASRIVPLPHYAPIMHALTEAERAAPLSTFDMFKIGVGPSSSHTMGPWRSAQRFVALLVREGLLSSVERIEIELYGSLAKTGRGHGTDIAVLLGLSGEDPETCEVSGLVQRARNIGGRGRVAIATAKASGQHAQREVRFDPARDIVFSAHLSKPAHANALTFRATGSGFAFERTYYSLGGGFIREEGADEGASGKGVIEPPHRVNSGDQLQAVCDATGKSIARVMWENELVWRSAENIRETLARLWTTMQECIFRGCSTHGVLPGGLEVARRAAFISRKLLAEADPFCTKDSCGLSVEPTPENLAEWKRAVRRDGQTFQDILKWVSCFALAVNEENAAFGRVVTAPTNGAAGVMPAVLMYAELFCPFSRTSPTTSQQPDVQLNEVEEFVLVAGVVGAMFKHGATISAAMGGCQAEIGVSSAMAAAGLTHVLGGSCAQSLMAAEIAMEHHLGMMCDPVGGLVQIPCIERNTMGAIKAITAANIAMESNPKHAKVSLDGVIRTMWETAKDMHSKYKETAEGGLAIQVPVGLSEC